MWICIKLLIIPYYHSIYSWIKIWIRSIRCNWLICLLRLFYSIIPHHVVGFLCLTIYLFQKAGCWYVRALCKQDFSDCILTASVSTSFWYSFLPVNWSSDVKAWSNWDLIFVMSRSWMTLWTSVREHTMPCPLFGTLAAAWRALYESIIVKWKYSNRKSSHQFLISWRGKKIASSFFSKYWK